MESLRNAYLFQSMGEQEASDPGANNKDVYFRI
jgi:hypothetical protein